MRAAECMCAGGTWQWPYAFSPPAVRLPVRAPSPLVSTGHNGSNRRVLAQPGGVKMACASSV